MSKDNRVIKAQHIVQNYRDDYEKNKNRKDEKKVSTGKDDGGLG